MTSHDWVRYWRADSIEVMHAHFQSHVYHRHSHDTYSFGVTDHGVQAFTCRGGAHVSTANMVMTFNPDDPHDGHAATTPGFTYRMIHIDPALVVELLDEAAGRDRPCAPRSGGRPLFPAPVVTDVPLARRLRLLHNVLTGPSTPLEQHEHLAATVRLLTRHASRRPAEATSPASALIANRVRALLHDSFTAPLTATDLAAAAGCSRFTATRAFSAVFGLAPSDYQRQLRLRAARTLLSAGVSGADTAATVGFADQAHLTRWFRRCYGVTPVAYRQAAATP
ncbi:MAG TPA: AraC family transcriptional regulator [Streptosporangiaceae bacterium]